MKQKFVKQLDINSVAVFDKKITNIHYRKEVPEIKNFWGFVKQKYRPEGYEYYNGNETLIYKDPNEIIKNWEKRWDEKLLFIDGHFYSPPNVIVEYKSTKHHEHHKFETYDEAIKFAERLATLCNLTAIYEK